MFSHTSLDTVVCPHCHNDVPLTKVVENQLREQLNNELATERNKLAAQVMAINEREATVSRLEQEVEARVALQVSQKVTQQLTLERKQLAVEAREQAKQELATEIDDQASQLGELQEQLKAARANELALRQSERKLKEQAESLELEIIRRVDAEREALRKRVRDEADESHRLLAAEKDLKIEGLKRKIDELKQKAEQGSVQLQGEVLELDITQLLTASFPHDAITGVPTGVNGADVQQVVRNNIGGNCGVILWETKRTKNWSDAWIVKLLDDQRRINASVAVIVSEVLPPDVKNIACIDGVWVCSRACAVGLALALRAGIIEIAKARQAAEGRSEKVQLVYNYLYSPAFQNRIAGIIESFVALQDQLVSEKRSTQRQWAMREKLLERAVSSSSGLCGDLEAIFGASMPQIEQLEHLRLEDSSSAA